MFDIIVQGIIIAVPINKVLQYRLTCFSVVLAGTDILLISPLFAVKSPYSARNE